MNLYEEAKILKEPVIMDLEGLDGNSFSLIAHFKKNARKQGVPDKEVMKVIDLATSKDWNYCLLVIQANTEPF